MPACTRIWFRLPVTSDTSTSAAARTAPAPRTSRHRFLAARVGARGPAAGGAPRASQASWSVHVRRAGVTIALDDRLVDPLGRALLELVLQRVAGRRRSARTARARWCRGRSGAPRTAPRAPRAGGDRRTRSSSVDLFPGSRRAAARQSARRLVDDDDGGVFVRRREAGAHARATARSAALAEPGRSIQTPTRSPGLQRDTPRPAAPAGCPFTNTFPRSSHAGRPAARAGAGVRATARGRAACSGVRLSVRSTHSCIAVVSW